MIKGIIAAVSMDSVIGKDNSIPWSHPEDMEYFKNTTSDSHIIMGKNTANSLPRKLKNRINHVISSKGTIPENKYDHRHSSIKDCIDFIYSHKQGLENIWYIGGASIYKEALLLGVDDIRLTLIPEIIGNKNTVYFPWIHPLSYQMYDVENLTTLKVLKYKKI